jgi:hypothetical protein
MAMRVPKPATSGAAALGGEPFVPAQSGYFNLSYPTPPMKTFAGDMWAGQQMQKLGSALTSLGNKFQQEFDQNQLLQIEKDWYDFENQLMDPASGILSQFGANAIGTTEATNLAIEAFKKDHGYGGMSSAGKRAADRLMLQRGGAVLSQARNNERKQLVTYNTELMQATIEQAVDMAAGAPLVGGGGNFEEAISRITQKVDTLGAYMGWSEEKKAEQLQIYTTAAAIGRVNAIATGDQGHSRDPVKALAELRGFFDEGLIDPETYNKAMATLKPVYQQFLAETEVGLALDDDWNEHWNAAAGPYGPANWQGYGDRVSLGTVADKAAEEATAAARRHAAASQGYAGRQPGTVMGPRGGVSSPPVASLAQGGSQLSAAFRDSGLPGQLSLGTGLPSIDAQVAAVERAWPESLDRDRWNRDKERLQRDHTDWGSRLGVMWEDRLRASGVTQMVPPPGMAGLNQGRAGHVMWNGRPLADAPAEVQTWVVANVHKYGLHAPNTATPGQVEVLGTRNGGPSSRMRTAPAAGGGVVYLPRGNQMGMLGGAKGNGGYWQTVLGKAHTGNGNPAHRDYSQLYRVYTYEKSPGYVMVGYRNGREVYAAPDYLRDPQTGNYVSVAAEDERHPDNSAVHIAEKHGWLIPTESEIRAVQRMGLHVKMPQGNGNDTEWGPKNSEYTRRADAAAFAAGWDSTGMVVHGKELGMPDDLAEGTAPAPGTAPPPVAAPRTNWLVMQNQGKTRNQPLSPELINALSFLGPMGVEFRVGSGGQPRLGSGGPRIGSTRHDDGGAADGSFWVNGRMLDWRNPQDIPMLRQIVFAAWDRGLTGIGAGMVYASGEVSYMGAGMVHVGGSRQGKDEPRDQGPKAWGRAGEPPAKWLLEAQADYLAGRREPFPGGGFNPQHAAHTPFQGVPASLIHTESTGIFTKSNNVKSGHFGRLQFNPDWIARAALEGVIPKMSPAQFLADPVAQKVVEQWYANEVIWPDIQQNYAHLIGTSIRGVPVTANGLFAVAHLGGQDGLKKFVESNGAYNKSDIYGTSLLDYLRRHGQGDGSVVMGDGQVVYPHRSAGVYANANPYGMSAGATRIYNMPRGTADEREIRRMAMEGYQAEKTWIDQQQNRQTSALIDTLTTEMHSAPPGTPYEAIVTPQVEQQLGSHATAMRELHKQIQNGVYNEDNHALHWEWMKEGYDAVASGRAGEFIQRWEDPAVQTYLLANLSPSQYQDLKSRAEGVYAAEAAKQAKLTGADAVTDPATPPEQLKIWNPGTIMSAVKPHLAQLDLSDAARDALAAQMQVSLMQIGEARARDTGQDIEGDVELQAQIRRMMTEVEVGTLEGTVGGVLQTIDKEFKRQDKTALDLVDEGFEIAGQVFPQDVLAALYDGFVHDHNGQAPLPSELVAEAFWWATVQSGDTEFLPGGFVGQPMSRADLGRAYPGTPPAWGPGRPDFAQSRLGDMLLPANAGTVKRISQSVKGWFNSEVSDDAPAEMRQVPLMGAQSISEGMAGQGLGQGLLRAPTLGGGAQ